MVKVSVIVPVYNSGKYIEKCIESIINQTYQNIEVLIVNDGSTDNSYSICNEYAKKDSRIKLFSIENSGVSYARNLGIENAQGKFITFVDSDDWIKSNMIDFAIEKQQQTNSDIIIWSCIKSYPNREILVPLLNEEDQSFIDDKSYLYLKSINYFHKQDISKTAVSAGTTWCKLYKREFLLKNNLQFNPKLTRAQDTIFSINAFYMAGKISYFNEHLYHYRENEGSITSGTKFIEDTETPFNALLNEFILFTEKLDKPELYKESIYIRATLILMWHLKHKYFHEKFEGNLFKRRKSLKKLLDNELYSESIKNVNLNDLPKKEKIMIKFFKRDMILFFYIVYKLNNKLIKTLKK